MSQVLFTVTYLQYDYCYIDKQSKHTHKHSCLPFISQQLNSSNTLPPSVTLFSPSSHLILNCSTQVFCWPDKGSSSCVDGLCTHTPQAEINNENEQRAYG